MATELTNIKVQPTSRTMLRLIAANDGKQMYEALNDVLEAEIKRRKIDLTATMRMIKRRVELKASKSKGNK